MAQHHIVQHQRNIEQLRATLAADPTNTAALRHLVRLEVIPRLEAELAAEHAKPNPDRGAIEALTQEIRDLHSNRVVPDHVREQILASVAEPVK